MVLRLGNKDRERSLNQGFTLLEIIFVSALALLVATGVLLSITSSGYAQARSELLFTADMVLTVRTEQVLQTPYDELDKMAGTEQIKQNGFDFQLLTSVQQVDEIGVAGVKKVVLEVSWEDRLSKGRRGRSVVRCLPL